MEAVDTAAPRDYAMSEGSSPRGDASSEASGFTSGSVATEAAALPQPAAELQVERQAIDRFPP